MLEKIRKCWNDLDVTVKVNKRELVLELAVCALTGLVVGMFASPRKNITVGSNNGGNIIDKRSAPDEECKTDVDAASL